MFDENEHLHPQNNDEGPRHIHRGIKRSEPDEVEVDSADFFSPEPPRPKAPPTPTPPSEPPKPPVPPRRQWEPLHPSEPAPADDKLPKGGMVLLVLQALLSLAALVQLCRCSTSLSSPRFWCCSGCWCASASPPAAVLS